MPVVPGFQQPSAVVPLSLQSLIDEALGLLLRPDQWPQYLEVGPNALTDETDNTLSLANGASVNISDVLEIGQELILVTGTDGAVPANYTVARGYINTPKAEAPTGTPMWRNPLWYRHEVRRNVIKGIRGPLSSYLPALRELSLASPQNTNVVPVPTEVIRVLRLGYVEPVSGTWHELPNWRLDENLPASLASSGKGLIIPTGLRSDTTISVLYQSRYYWSDGSDNPTDESATVGLPMGAEDLPALYAAASMVSRREISRIELDKVEQWNQEESIRQGVNVRLISQLWSEFYRRLDEARRITTVPKHRPFRKMGRI